MSVRYLLPCPACERPIPIIASQAGGTVRCECGASCEAPRLRDLRLLPQEAPATPPKAAWGPRQGFVTALLLIASTLGGAGAWFAWQEPPPPPPFDAEARTKVVQEGLDSLSPLDAWRMFQGSYLPLLRVGLQDAPEPRTNATKQKIEWCRRYRNGLWTAAGVVLLGAVGVALTGGRRSGDSSG